MDLPTNKTFLRNFSVRGVNKLEEAFKKMSDSEKLITLFFSFLLLLSVLMILGKINTYLVIEIPTNGGELKEGVIGFPRFVNPLLASSDADRDLTILVYSGLMRATPNGDLVHDLAESHTISDDGLIYTFKIRDNARFHDGTRVTADDILFTISKTRDTILKSSKRANWEGVVVEKLSEREVQFFLREPYTPFLENTTIGILPKHIWENVEPEQFAFSSFNIEPVGSGPYKIKGVNRNSSGIPEFYSLESFEDYTLGKPYIDKIEIHFYSNEELLIKAYKDGKVDAINSISSETANELSKNNRRIEQFPLPRIFGIFFNQNQEPLFANREVRKALNIAVDREKIVSEILGSYGTPITSPIPGSVINQEIFSPEVLDESASSTEQVLLSRDEVARAILKDSGWKFNEEKDVMVKETKTEDLELRFTISTSNAAELKKVADIVKESWEKIGARVEVQLFEIGNLNQDVIRPRKYDTLLFGEIVGRERDLFAFWHSSQRNDPGLNIALYANITVDTLLEDIRTTANKDVRRDIFDAFENEIQNDVPAVFLYSPDFIYVVPKNIKGFNLGTVTTPAERFLAIYEWYIKTDRVWQFFTN